MSTPDPKPQNVTSQQNSEPWSVQKPYLEQGFKEAQNIYNQGPQQFYPGRTFVDPSQATLQSLAGTEARALQGSPVLGAAQNEAQKSLSGDYLSAGNPYFSQMADRVRASVVPAISGQFSNAGGAGGLQGRAVGLGLGDALGSLAYQNYGDERNRMQNAMAQAPGLAQADYLDPAMLGQVGAQREQIAQQPITEAIARHDYEQMAPNQALAQYMQMISGNYGGQTTGTTQQLIPQQNPWTTALGGLLGGVGAVGSLQPWKWSDERLKENIEPIGKMNDGTNIYRYNYLDGGPTHFGVMAQEILETKPEAVTVQPLFGKPFLAVDYAKL